MDTSVAFVIALVIMVVGTIGTLVPGIPGVPLTWIGLLLFGILDRFQHLSPVAFILLTLIAAVGATAGFWSTQFWTRASGASGLSSIAGSCLLVLGLLFFTLPYAILMALLGVFGLEWRRKSDAKRAALSSSAWLIGWLLSTLIEFLSAAVVVIFFVGSFVPGLP